MFFKKIILAAAFVASLSLSQSASADMFTLDTSHSDVGFTITHMMISDVDGEFKNFSGEITWDESDPTKSVISGKIMTDSIDTDNEKRDAHLKGADFFDAAKNPEITFKTKTIEKKDAGYLAKGTLTMKGVTKDVDIPFTVTQKIKDPFGNTRMGLKGSIDLNRKDFGITWNKAMDAGGMVLGDVVKVSLNVEAILKP